MAEPMLAREDDQRQSEESLPLDVRRSVERLRAIFDDLEAYAGPNDEEMWEALVTGLDAERPEGMKLFPKK